MKDMENITAEVDDLISRVIEITKNLRLDHPEVNRTSFVRAQVVLRAAKEALNHVVVEP